MLILKAMSIWSIFGPFLHRFDPISFNFGSIFSSQFHSFGSISYPFHSILDQFHIHFIQFWINFISISFFWINFISISFNFDWCFDMIYSLCLNRIYFQLNSRKVGPIAQACYQKKERVGNTHHKDGWKNEEEKKGKENARKRNHAWYQWVKAWVEGAGSSNNYPKKKKKKKKKRFINNLCFF